jgi:hypothetical protein
MANKPDIFVSVRRLAAVSLRGPGTWPVSIERLMREYAISGIAQSSA